ncbi:ribosomal-processing cysteine protease Prp [Clostridium bovifaecis]|uniref:Ribosomal processing cysteine protease Prp n=1 Tax=Clostridium bovifaecis TaxID=2184719 RepID=A0A6I6FCJ0_9CLOT|nr:ribosomal-processing cysteine protease Prp [Clostridium bovifaecis]
MTSVIFKKKDEYLISFRIEGHSGFDEEGEDIVCSAISMISQTTLIGILEVLKIDVEYYIEDGFLNLSLEKKSMGEIEKSQVLLQTMLLGLRNIEITYGDYINVKVEEV